MNITKQSVVQFVAVFLCLLFLGACGDGDRDADVQGQAGSVRNIIIDTDTAMGVPTGLDVDDDLAVLFALASPQVDVLGLTITYGNAPTSRTYPDAVRLMEQAGKTQMPVLSGADWSTRDVYRSTDASRFLIDTILAGTPGVTVVAIGAMTNLAAALVQEPRIEERINQIVMMGGYLKEGTVDLNFAAHPEASEIILETTIPKVVVPAETCMQTTFTPVELGSLNEHPEAVVYAYRNRLALFVLFWSILGDILYADFPDRATGGFFPWDVVAMAYLTNPEVFQDVRCFFMQMNGEILESAPCNDPGDHRNRIMVPMKLHAQPFNDLMVQRICSVPLANSIMK